MIQFEMPRQQRYQLVADDESDMPEWAEEYTICNLRSGSDPGPYMFCGGEWVMLSSYAVRDGTLKIYHDVKAGDQPWDGDASEVREVVVADTVKSIGAGAFASLENLEYVSIPAGVEVEDGAFSQTFKDPFDADIAMADVAGYEYVAYEGVMYQCDPAAFIYNGSTLMGYASGYSGMVNMVIPSHSTSGNVVTGTAVDSFVNSASLTKVFMLPDSGLTTIGVRTFQGCTSLSYIRLMDPLASLGSYAMQGCTSLTSIEFPSSMRVVGTFCFRSDTQLESVILNKGLTSLEEHAFRDCSAIKSMAFPSTIETMGSNVFNGCRDVAEVSFAEGFNATIASSNTFSSWTFYAADGTTTIDKTVASNLAGKTFKGSASRLVEDAGPQPGMEGRYMYAITTDSAGMNILSVQAAHDGRPLDTIVTASTRRQGAENIPDEWGFENGVGPFKCWYGAFNIQDYVAGTEGEAPVCTGAGMLAYRLDPYDLGRTMQGTTLQGTYNVFLVVPTVYWKAVGNTLYLSDDSSYAGVTGMTAYAHTATSDGTSSVYPFIGIGVYESYSDGTRLLSTSGKLPATGINHDGFKALADALASSEGSDFQQWNYYQWTFYKIMAYTVLGTKNAQWMLGDGPVNGNGPSDTGQADTVGPYAQATSQYDKVFIENAWGSVWNFAGDAYTHDCVLHVGNALGGATLMSQPEAPGSPTVPSLDGAAVWIKSSYITAPVWDLPLSGDNVSSESDPSKSGDRIWSRNDDRCLMVGGRWSNGQSAGFSCIAIDDVPSIQRGSIGARLSAFFDGTAMGTPEVTTKAAPAPTRTMEEELPEAERDEPAEEPVEEAPEEPVAEESDEGSMDIEGL